MNRAPMCALFVLTIAGCSGETRELKAVRLALKDPASAQFQNVKTVVGPDGISRTCGSVNARNSFGGYAGLRSFAVQGSEVVFESSDPLVAALQHSAFEKCNRLPATTISDEDRKELEAVLKS